MKNSIQRSLINSKTSTLGLAVLMAGALNTHADTIFSDDFATGIDSWSFIGGNNIAPNNESDAFGNSMVYTSNGSNSTAFSRMTASFAPQTLNVGDTLSVTVSYQGLQYVGNNSNYFAFGFVDNEVDQNGVGAMIRARPSGSAFAGFHDFAEYGTPIDSGSAYAGPAVTGNTFLLSDDNLNDIFQFTFNLTKLEGNELALSATYLNVSTSASFTITNTIDSSQDTFGSVLLGYQRGGSAAVQAILEIGSVDVSVTPIPEPSTYAAIFGLGAGLLILAKRRRD